MDEKPDDLNNPRPTAKLYYFVQPERIRTFFDPNDPTCIGTYTPAPDLFGVDNPYTRAPHYDPAGRNVMPLFPRR